MPAMTGLPRILTVTLNTAVDTVLVAEGFTIGAHQHGELRLQAPAGKGINVSRALARVGRTSLAAGFVGREDFRWFDRELRSLGPARVTPQFLSVPGRTRRNYSIIDPVGHTDTHIRDRGFTVTDEDLLRLTGKLAMITRPGMTVVFGGSLPPGVSPEAFDQLVDAAQAAGGEVVLDVDGDLLATFVHALRPGEPRARLAFVKPNVDELARMAGRDGWEDDGQMHVAARKLLRLARFVVLSRGADGACLLTEDGCWIARPGVGPQSVRSTVGSGDCLVAGVIDALAEGQAWAEVIRRGVALGTANALRDDIAGFTLDDVAAVSPGVQVEAC